jgi:hypothetical protein
MLKGNDIPSLEEMTDHPSDLLREACNDQKFIGWENFLRGRLTKKWGNVYTSTYIHNN